MEGVLDYLAGYVDGDGTITAGIWERKNGKLGFSAQISVYAHLPCNALETVISGFKEVGINPHIQSTDGGRAQMVGVHKYSLVRKMAETLEPRLIAKSNQARVMQLVIDSRIEKDNNSLKRNIQALKDMNKTGVVRGTLFEPACAPLKEWIAGVFDSDGNMYWHKGKPIARLTNCDLRIIRSFEEYCKANGFKHSTYFRKSNRKTWADSYQVCLYGDSALQFESSTKLLNKSFRPSTTTRVAS